MGAFWRDEGLVLVLVWAVELFNFSFLSFLVLMGRGWLFDRALDASLRG